MLALLMLMLSPVAQSAETQFTLTSPRNKTVRVTLSLPEGKGKVPALIAAPGAGYHQGLPIFQTMRERGASAGYAVYTFDWNYFSENGKRSEKGADELEDMMTVIAHARANERIDGDKILISGKSFGSIIAYRAFQKFPGALGLHLLTPICGSAEQMDGYYPGVSEISKPLLFLFGTADEACDPRVVKSKLALAGANLALVMVPGAHSFEFGPIEDPAFAERNDANLRAVVGLITQWAKVQLGL